MTAPLMTADAVVAIYEGLKRRGVTIWIDGGWGVDALMGRQTRSHGDLDIVIQEKDVIAMCAFLEAQGFHDSPRPDTRAWNFVLADNRGQQVDVHVVVLDADGTGIYGPRANGQFYPADALRAHGLIAGTTVHCTSAKFQIQCHSGFALRDSDYHDVRLLAEKFGLELPPDHRR